MLRCPQKLSSQVYLPFAIRSLVASITLPIHRRTYSKHNLAIQDPDQFQIEPFEHPNLKPLKGGRNSVAREENHSVLQASCLQHRFKNWQEKRSRKLTASTFALAVGFFPHRRVQLWLEKIGAKEPFTGGLSSCWNNIKEEEALQRYKLITGEDLQFLEFQSLNDDPESWLAASPDAVVQCGNGGILEVKCPFFNGDMKKASPWGRIPLYYIPQAQGLMEILDREWIELYCWTPKGSSLFRVYRDRCYWSLLKAALGDFWWKHVVPAREVYSNYEVSEPLVQLRSFRPACRHELLPLIVIRSKVIVDNSPFLWREIDGVFEG